MGFFLGQSQGDSGTRTAGRFGNLVIEQALSDGRSFTGKLYHALVIIFSVAERHIGGKTRQRHAMWPRIKDA